MKKTLLASALLCAGLAFAGGANAYTVNSGATDVGSLDTLIESAALSNSSEGGEEAWIESVLGIDVTYSQLLNSGGDFWTKADGANDVYAFDFGGDAGDWFMIKTGNVGAGSVRWFLFDNASSTQWAVVSLANSFGDNITLANIGKVSHVGGNVGEVPLPGAAWLFGSALLGFMAVANRRRV